MELEPLNSSYDNLLKENREMRKKLNQYEKAYPAKECPVCGHKGIDFIPFPNIIHKEVICPTCHCHERQRALWLYFQKNKNLINDGTRILHFAPEKQFKELFTSKDTEYHTADFNPGDYADADEKIDIQDIPYDDNYFDLILCSHVLEHVPDDMRALRELRRVLKPQGIALIMVPMNGVSYNLPYDEFKTLEKDEYNTPELREKHYGQFDHLRLYGADFKQRIFESGFELLGEDFIKNLGLETIERYALVRNEKIYECTK